MICRSESRKCANGFPCNTSHRLFLPLCTKVNCILYMYNNFTSPVLFRNFLHLIPLVQYYLYELCAPDGSMLPNENIDNYCHDFANLSIFPF